ncbi:MAG TPA: ABC transporter permease [Egibacteraceae bacterium]|nr:ABC transporter permease [Egibacteraceae bacterium]
MLSRESMMALVRHNLLLARRDLAPLAVTVAMPLVLMAFLQPVLQLSLVSAGYADAGGAEQAVPGMTVMFTLFMVAVVGFRIFEEHGWGTWDRLRASPAGPAAIMVGKIAPSFAVVLAQLAVLFGGGVALYGLRIAGAASALALLAVALGAMVVSLGVLLAAYARTAQQLNALANVGATALACLGGALVPLSALPAWAQSVAPATPTYWAMRGFRAVILDGGGIVEALAPVMALLGFAGLFAALAALRFRFDEPKTSFA